MKRWIACAVGCAVMAAGLAARPGCALADIQPPQQEAIRRFERIELEATRESSTTDSEFSQILSDTTENRRDRAAGFLGFALGPVYLGISQQAGQTDRVTSISEDRAETLQTDGLASVAVRGIFTDDSDGLLFMGISSYGTEDHFFFDAFSGIDLERRTETHTQRGGLFYEIFGVGLGTFQGTQQEDLRLDSSAQAPMEEQYTYGIREHLFAVNLGQGEGLFANLFLVTGETDRVRGESIDREPSTLDFQFTAVGYRYDGDRRIVLSGSRLRSTNEYTGFYEDESVEERSAISLIAPPFSLSFSLEDTTTRREIQQSGITEITDTTFHLTRVSLGYVF